MGTCQLDHSWEDVNKKLADQKSFLPEELYNKSSQLLETKPNQLTLNELFHVLKKFKWETSTLTMTFLVSFSINGLILPV